MTAQEMSERILALIQTNHGGVSFIEMMQCIGDEAHGDLSLELRENLVLWSGMSPTFVDAITMLKDKIEPVPTSVLVYLCDGALMKMPVAKKLSKVGYKKPHWLPVAFSLKSPANASRS